MTREERQAISKAWIDVAEDALIAANELRNAKRFRSSLSRSYYAAYSFLAAALVLNGGVTFRDDREGPEHEPLSDLIADKLKGAFGPSALSQVRNGIKTLYNARLSADYKPRASVRDVFVSEALKEASAIAKAVRNLSK